MLKERNVKPLTPTSIDEQMTPEFWWTFINLQAKKSRVVSFYDFLMHGYISYSKPVVRWDHPGRKLAESVFSKRLLGEKRSAK